jgi:uncharacterized OB-fold protein
VADAFSAGSDALEARIDDAPRGLPAPPGTSTMTERSEFALAPDVMPTPTLPNISALTRPYWDAAAAGRYLLPHCNACGAHFFRPEVACPRCFAIDWRWVEASGRGTLYSYSIVHRAPAPGFEVPFVFAAIELDEGPCVFSNIVGCAHADIRIGMKLQVQFDAVAPGIHLPRFHPAS